MATNDLFPDPESPDVPTSVVATVDISGLVTIYDEQQQGAWISSPYAIELQQAI
ncbi:hypothetical protein [Natrarchaeobaculum sulfurireducens]|uniref:Uncharacterized protein n=1 Tax=Natrarchaeobaculum sulfurireducens TaxID=2044521 RepID=A0A346PSS2_9EURY|nr:hypothetical protein [Natrarchaeobaculum sulfurireducens]AXR77462.1 hypothetical protein AArc1_1121 [Natrarchaeobaculum sulfurireducens]AXR82567.1 hypothetical protein AArcMg_2577 [Natrarchaeobaculum sulfurireducens]